VVQYAQKFNVEVVLCGHIHSVSIRPIGNVTYYNCGDWVESCTAMIEDYTGEIEVVSYLPRTRMPRRIAPAEQPALATS
jgi:UDP-2,3-diacylglucosamine pyrophosphatase LpxH